MCACDCVVVVRGTEGLTVPAPNVPPRWMISTGCDSAVPCAEDRSVVVMVVVVVVRVGLVLVMQWLASGVDGALGVLLML